MGFMSQCIKRRQIRQCHPNGALSDRSLLSFSNDGMEIGMRYIVLSISAPRFTTLRAYPKTVGDWLIFAESSEQKCACPPLGRRGTNLGAVPPVRVRAITFVDYPAPG